MKPFDYVMGVTLALVFTALVALLGMNAWFWYTVAALTVLFAAWQAAGMRADHLTRKTS